MIIKMFVPFNDALKSLISSAVKLTWNEAISLNSREPLQIPFTGISLDSTTQWTEINAMTSSKSEIKVKRRTEQTWLKRNSKCHDPVKVLFFLRITMNKAFFSCKA